MPTPSKNAGFEWLYRSDGAQGSVRFFDYKATKSRHARASDGLAKAATKAKAVQHAAFPCGPPPEYYPHSIQLNFAVRMGSGDPG